MIKENTTKTYTIKYSKSGIYQYADFSYVDGILVRNTFHPSWVDSKDLPSLKDVNDIDEILQIIKKFSYCNRAEIFKINGVLPEYHANITIVPELEHLHDKFTELINTLSQPFFKNQILPILKKNKWKISHSWVGYPILICKKNKEWDNIDSQHKDHILIEYMCHRFLYDVLGVDEHFSNGGEQGYCKSNNFAIFLKYISNEYLKNIKVLITLNE